MTKKEIKNLKTICKYLAYNSEAKPFEYLFEGKDGVYGIHGLNDFEADYYIYFDLSVDGDYFRLLNALEAYELMPNTECLTDVNYMRKIKLGLLELEGELN